jgi:hypothetical protein
MHRETRTLLHPHRPYNSGNGKMLFFYAVYAWAMREALGLCSQSLRPPPPRPNTSSTITYLFPVLPADRGTKRQGDSSTISAARSVRPWVITSAQPARPIRRCRLRSRDSSHSTNKQKASSRSQPQVASSRQRDTPQTSSSSYSRSSGHISVVYSLWPQMLG